MKIMLLVTPAEKVGIKVDDAPFVAVDFSVVGSGNNQTLIFEPMWVIQLNSIMKTHCA